MAPKFPYGISVKAVAKNHNSVCCDTCNLWVHMKFNNIAKSCYRNYQNSQDPQYCKKRVAKRSLISSPKKIIQKNNDFFTGAPSGLRQFLVTEIPLKW